MYSFSASEIARVLPKLRRSHFNLDAYGYVYLRLALRTIDGIGIRTLDLADVDVHEEARRNRIFTHALDVIELAAELLECDAVYVQSIVNPIVARTLEKRGYSLCIGFIVGEATALDAYKPTHNPEHNA